MILLFIFINIDCGESEICYSLSKIDSISHGISIVYFIFRSIWNALIFFFKLYFINYYTILHYFIILLFINDVFFDFFNLICNFEIFNLIIIIFTSLIGIVAMFIFYEYIELNFCGLNTNLKKI